MQPDTSGRKKASDFPQELLDIFHLYVHGEIDRRAFFDRAKNLRSAASQSRASSKPSIRISHGRNKSPKTIHESRPRP